MSVVTRLNSIGIGARAYAGFSPKTAAAIPAIQITVLGPYAFGMRKRPAFLPKDASTTTPSVMQRGIVALLSVGRLINR